MYESYFGFSESPFENNLDHRFLFISDDHKEVLAALSYFIKTKKGFAIVCGDVGTGKTMLINSFLSTLPEYVQPIIIANPVVSSLELLRYIVKTLKIEVEEKDGIPELTDAVKEFLKKAKSLNKQFVLIIDEAHLLSDQALEEIRLLSNIETQDQKLLQILLVGQSELSHKLDRPEMRHLRQRINVNRILSPLNSLETMQYVDHRLRQVGSSLSAIFEEDCGRAIYKMTRGVPRNINQLCDSALLICMSEKRQKVDRRILREAQEALVTDRLFTPKFAKLTSALRHKFSRVVVWTAVGVTFLALGIVLSQASFPGKMGQQLSREASRLTGSVPDPKAASAILSSNVKNEIPVPLGQESSSKVVSPGGETSPNSGITTAVPQTVSPSDKDDPLKQIATEKPIEAEPPSEPKPTEVPKNVTDPQIRGDKNELLEKFPLAAPQAEEPIRREKMGANTIQDLFQGQMDYIFFFQGLAFFLVLVVCCLFRGDTDQRLPWRWLGLFALAQGIAAWLSLVAINFAEPSHLKGIGASLHLISWIFLMEFGRSGMNRNQSRDSGLWLVALLLMVTALGGLKGWSGIGFISRYTLGLTGGLWAATAIFATGRDLASRDRSSSLIAGICLALFGVSTALSPPHSPLFPASFLNQDVLRRLTGVPMEFFQGLLAFGIAAGIYGFLPWREKEEATQDTRYRTRYMFALLGTLSIILGLGSVLTLYMGDWAHNQHEKVKAEAHEYATIVVNRLNTEFKRLDDAGKALAETSWLSLTIRTNREENLLRINNLLDRYKTNLEASVCYLMDTTGKTIASSNRADPDSFVGHNYGFRPYFKQAINGSIGRYFALGVTSKVPGYYVGSPVRVPRGTTTRGVAVIKVSMDKITHELQAAVQKGDSMMCLADPRGIVFLATNQDMVFKSLWPVEGDRAALQEQYGKDKFPAIFPTKFGDGAKVELQGRNYMVSYAGTIHAGWSVYFFRPIERVGMYRLSGILMACILALLALVSLGGNFYLKEYTLASAGRSRAILDSAPEAVAVLDPHTSQLLDSNRYMTQFLGYTQKELLSFKLADLVNQEPQKTHDQLQQIIQDGSTNQNWQVRHKNGTYVNLEIIGAKLRQRGKDQALIFGREASLSSQTRHHQQGHQPAGAEALPSGKLDEFNNILSSLIMQTEMTLDEQPPESSVSENLQGMLQAAVRAKDLVREMAIRPHKELLDQKTATLQKKHILLVDDEAQLCRLEEKLLLRLGYQVSAFTDSLSALKAFRKNPDKFDLVITDSSMSDLSGLELAQELLRVRPNLPIILATGFSETEEISRAQQIGIRECLEKPILAGDLDKTIWRLLGKPDMA